MSVLTASELTERILSGNIGVSGDALPQSFITPEDVQNSLALRNAKWELRLGSEYTLLSEAKTGLVGDRVRSLGPGESFYLEPQDWVLVRTREEIRLPTDLVAFVTSKLGLTLLGATPVSTVVDPGFAGYLVVGIGNSGGHRLELRWNDPIVTLTVQQVSRPTAALSSIRAQKGNLFQTLYRTELKDWFERITGATLPPTPTVDEVLDAYRPSPDLWSGLSVPEMRRELASMQKRIDHLQSLLDQVLSLPEMQ